MQHVTQSPDQSSARKAAMFTRKEGSYDDYRKQGSGDDYILQHYDILSTTELNAAAVQQPVWN